MPMKNLLFSTISVCPVRCVLFLLVLILLRIPSAATDATATKDCSLGPPCTITTSGSFTLNFSQMISWQANYLGSGTQRGATAKLTPRSGTLELVSAVSFFFGR